MKLYKGKMIAYLIASFTLLGSSEAFSFECPTLSQVRATNFDEPVKKDNGYFVVGKVATDCTIYMGIVEIHNQSNPTIAQKEAQNVIKNDNLHDPVSETISGDKQACVYYGNVRDQTNPSVFVINWGSRD